MDHFTKFGAPAMLSIPKDMLVMIRNFQTLRLSVALALMTR
jgi:hypothetical protein